ncbi:MAG: hypothetical protein ACR2N3_18405 [Pyrinomonadaceae bacterium]
MKKDFFKILLILLLALTGCKKSSDSSSGGLDILGISDQTDDAGKIVADANVDLKKIKVIYKNNETSVKELEDAMNAQDVEKVKKIAGDLVNEINNGMALGESAVAKIDDAENLKINETYRNYLDLKKAALRKQLDAFEFRRQSAILLRDGFGGKDKLEIEKAKAALKEREDNFKRLMATAKDMSEEANQIAKDSLKK